MVRAHQPDPEVVLKPSSNQAVRDHDYASYHSVLGLLDARSGLILRGWNARPSERVLWLPDGRLLLLASTAAWRRMPHNSPSLVQMEDPAKKIPLPPDVRWAMKVIPPATPLTDPLKEAGTLSDVIRWVIPDSSTYVTAVASEGRLVLIGGDDGIIRIHAATPEGLVTGSFSAHAGQPVHAIRVAPDGRRVLSIVGLNLALTPGRAGPGETAVPGPLRPAPSPGARLATLDVSSNWRLVMIGDVGGRAHPVGPAGRRESITDMDI